MPLRAAAKFAKEAQPAAQRSSMSAASKACQQRVSIEALQIAQPVEIKVLFRLY